MSACVPDVRRVVRHVEFGAGVKVVHCPVHWWGHTLVLATEYKPYKYKTMLQFV